ncbi:MAG TPA: hypothetical protein VJN67_12490 [Stellaceae bacterium]|nr:hypothetical protein [Stellaceae bacterium]
MTTLVSVALSVVVLASTPGLSDKAGPMDLTQAQAFTVVANVLGAATACEEIPHARVSAAAHEVAAHATAQALSVEDVTKIERLLMISAAAGRQAVEGGHADCKTVEAAFGELEQVMMQTPV